MLSLESAVPIEGPELTKLAARALRESAQGRSQGWSDSSPSQRQDGAPSVDAGRN